VLGNILADGRKWNSNYMEQGGEAESKIMEKKINSSCNFDFEEEISSEDLQIPQRADCRNYSSLPHDNGWGWVR